MDKEQLDEKQKRQEEYYLNLADHYDAHFKRENTNHLYKIEQIGECFFNHFKDPSRKYDFMEIGGGTGIHAYHFLKAHSGRINKFVLTDLSAPMLKQAEKRLEPFAALVEFIAMPAEHISTNRLFDGIYISGAMHHFSNPYQSLVEIRKHLKPGGLVVICEPVVSNPVNFYKAAINKEEWGQFSVVRSNIRNYLQKLNFKIIDDKVLHYKTDNTFIKTILPFKKLEQYRLFDPLAIMFLLSASPV